MRFKVLDEADDELGKIEEEGLSKHQWLFFRSLSCVQPDEWRLRLLEVPGYEDEDSGPSENHKDTVLSLLG